MADPGVHVSGLEATLTSLRRFSDGAADLEGSFTKIGGLVVNEAETLVRRRSGALAGTIRAKAQPGRVAVQAGAESMVYAPIQHYGGYHNIEPNLFLTRALADQEAPAARIVEQDLRGLIRGLGLN